MNRDTLKAYLSSRYQGAQSFLDNVIFPIFGEDDFEDEYEAEQLQTREDSRVITESTGIQSIKALGKIYVGAEPLQIFDVTVSDRVIMERNRVGVQRLIRRIMDQYSCAFMIFHYKADVRWDWRFSFCHKKTSNADASDSKRFTYLLGPGQSCRTAADNFMTIYEKRGNIEVDDIEKAFSVEALSKEFFGKYKDQYDKFVEYLSNPANGMRDSFIDTKFDPEGLTREQVRDREEKPIRDYVKKLLGRIVFLHFLQKKGWLGVPAGKEWGNGDPEFMLNLYKNATPWQKENFLDEILEPLFNDAFDKNRSKDNDLYDTKVEGFRNVRIPYLNGGLFERDPLDENPSRFPKARFWELLDMLSQYNFTIDENDPNDAEVGVDPEMLGRIFENLLEDNKDKGAFYTPKEIVKYMCQESLIAYLQTDYVKDEVKDKIRRFVFSHNADDLGSMKGAIDVKLKEVKICDPAIGSGAFPMGLLRELFYCRCAIEPNAAENAAEIKREIIENNIYGVDIEKGAVDIARLRFWLSLIVEEKSPITLPNLDFKIMQGNSLLEQYQGYDLSTLTAPPRKTEFDDNYGRQTSFYDDEIDMLRDVLLENLKKYYSCDDHNQRVGLRREIADLVQKQINAKNVDRSIKNIDISANTEFFLWHTWFNDVFSRPMKGGFDIVIGNPPYIKEYTNKKAFDGFREHSPYYMGKMDLWYGFACHSLDIAVKRGGILCFIAQNNWTTSAGAKIFRNKVVRDCKIIQMIDFNDYMVFGGSASIQTMIMLFANDTTTDNYVIDHRLLKANAGKKDMEDLLNTKETPITEYLRPIFNRGLYVDKFITFSKEENLISKIAEAKMYITDHEAINGIHPHYDFVDKKIHKNHPQTVVGEGIFGLSDVELKGLDLNDIEKGLIKPYFTTNEIKRYYSSPNNKLWIIYTTSEYKDEHSMDAMPTLKAHLDKFRGVISSDNKPYGLHRARQIRFFNGEKIAVQRKCCGMPSFSYSNFPCFVSATFYVIQTSRWNMKFLTGVLNSRLIAFWLRHKGKMQGENYQIDKEPLMNIPLPSPDIDQTDIIEQVDIILDKLSKNQTADISAEENVINNLVYQIYGLSPSEIEVIERD